MHQIETNPSDRKFQWLHLILPLVVFLIIATICEVTSLDLILSDQLFDFHEGIWPARESFWASWLIHKRGRDFIVILTVLNLLIWLSSFFAVSLRTWRRHALYLLLVIILATGLVTMGKRLTNRHCPWDMSRYGGEVPYTSLFEGTPPGYPPGKCFPAGHASGGYAMMGLYFVFRDRNRRLAYTLLAATFALGSLFGYAQMARGAHFFSHNVWTTAICWFTALFLYRYMINKQAD